MIRAVLVDDEPLAVERLRIALDSVPDIEVVGAARCAESATQAVEALRPDLVFLDISLPGRSGFAVAAALMERPVQIVFVTGHEQYALEAFEFEAVDYLVKPVSLERLRTAVERARRRRGGAVAAVLAQGRPAHPEPSDGGRGSDYAAEFWVQGKHGAQRVGVEDLIWIEAARDYVILHAEGRRHLMRTKMHALESRLDPAIVVRAHRSAFVNLSKVTAVRHLGRGQHRLIMSDGAAVDLGPSFADRVFQALKVKGKRASSAAPDGETEG